MTCVICTHPQRAEIENELLCRQWGASEVTLESISDKYGVPMRDLQVHALMHVPVQQVSGEASSIAQKINLVEADALRNTISNYYVTLTNLGRRINKMIADDDDSLRGLNKSVIDLYLGTGAEIRNATDCLVKMNQAINGEDSSGLSALASLVNTIRGDRDDTVETIQS